MSNSVESCLKAIKISFVTCINERWTFGKWTLIYWICNRRASCKHSLSHVTIKVKARSQGFFHQRRVGLLQGVKHFCKQAVSGDRTALQFLQSSGRLFDGLPRLARRRDLQVGGLHAPDLCGVIRDGSVAGELPSGGDVLDHHLCPLLLIL